MRININLLIKENNEFEIYIFYLIIKLHVYDKNI